MTAEEEELSNVFRETGFDIDNKIQQKLVLGAMKSYAKMKCQELLEIVAEKANIRHTFTSAIDGKTAHSYDKIFSAESSMFTVDKDSILNAVDLEKFCS